MNPKAYLRLLLSPLLILAGCMHCGAQAVVFTAASSAAKIGTSDQVQVTYTIEDAPGIRSLNPGTALKDFRILAGPFTGYQMVGRPGAQSTTYTFTFVLQAKRAGILTLAPATVSDDAGRSYRSNPLQIEVVNGSLAARPQRRTPAKPTNPDDDLFNNDPLAQAMQQQAAMMQQMQAMSRRQPVAQQPPVSDASAKDLSKDIFIHVDVDKKAVRLGEQITASYKLYSRVPVNVAITKKPSLNKFWTQDFDIPRQPLPEAEIVNGKRYNTLLLKKSALFPQQAGTLTLDPAEAEGMAHIARRERGVRSSGDPYLDDLVASITTEDVPVHLVSTPLAIQVSALPTANKPADYTGAVGTFSLTSKMDKMAITTDDVATITLTISGSGNLSLFGAPKLRLPAGLNAYDPQFLDTITGRSTTISGEKVVTYSIAASEPGDYTIPPLSLSWYDPEANAYKSATSTAFRLRVKGGKGSSALAKGAVKREEIQDSLNVPFSAKPFILTPVYWTLYMLPMLALIGVSVYRRRADKAGADTAQSRNKLANKVAQKRLAAAGTRLGAGDARAFYDEVSKAIWLYLSDKLAIPLSALGKGSASSALLARGVPQSVQQQIEKVAHECEIALYTPGGSGTAQMQQTFSEAASIITGLERTLRTAPLHA